MADVTISGLSLNTPNKNSAIIPYSDGSTTYKTSPSGIVAASPGCILQVKSTFSKEVKSFTNLDGEFIRINIKPNSIFNSIKIDTSFSWCGNNPNGYFAIQRSADNINWIDVGSGEEGGVYTPGNGFMFTDEIPIYSWYLPNAPLSSAPLSSYKAISNIFQNSFTYLDSPNTTNNLIYRLYWKHAYKNGGTMVMNATYVTEAGQYYARASSTITAMEIAG